MNTTEKHIPTCPICGKPMEEIRGGTFVCVNEKMDCGTGARVWMPDLDGFYKKYSNKTDAGVRFQNFNNEEAN